MTWATWVNGGVNEVRVSDDGTTVWIGGEFTRIRGIDRLYLGAIDATTGVPTAFSPTGSGGRIITIELGPDESWVYASTDNNTVFAYQHALSNDPTWLMKMSGNVQAMAATETDLYLGGHFSQFVTEHIARPFLGSANPSTGSATTWDPKASGLKGGGWAFVVKGGYLHAGGQFTHFDGVPPDVADGTSGQRPRIRVLTSGGVQPLPGPSKGESIAAVLDPAGGREHPQPEFSTLPACAGRRRSRRCCATSPACSAARMGSSSGMMRLKAVAPASLSSARRSATWIGVPWGTYRSKRSNGVA